MSLRDAVLAALLEAEASGYDLAKSFDASVANFWMATPQQLYRELDRLAEQGLIQCAHCRTRTAAQQAHVFADRGRPRSDPPVHCQGAEARCNP